MVSINRKTKMSKIPVIIIKYEVYGSFFSDIFSDINDVNCGSAWSISNVCKNSIIAAWSSFDSWLKSKK